LKFCVIGNSHVGALKRAVTAGAGEGHDFVFFAAPGRQLSEITSDGECLRAQVPGSELEASLIQTSGGDGTLQPREFDAILVYGLSFHAFLLERNLSKAVFEQVHIDNLDASIAAKVADHSRGLADIPVLLGHEPMLAWRPKRLNMQNCYPYDEVLISLKNIVERRGFKFLPQCSTTIEPDGWGTQDQYAVGGTGLGNAAKERIDKSHMNAAYGGLAIASFLRMFELAPAP
jgi:hypothetical protein